MEFRIGDQENSNLVLKSYKRTVNEREKLEERVRMNIFKISDKHTTLTKLSAITVAEWLWDLQIVKRKMRDFLQKYRDELKNEISLNIQELWISLVIAFVVDKVDLLYFPVKLVDEVKNYVFTIGGLIFHFIRHVTKNGFDIDFGLNILWASYGRIDEVAMARRLLQGHAEDQPLPDRFLSLADIYAHKDLVGVSMNRFKEEEEKCHRASFQRFTAYHFRRGHPLCNYDEKFGKYLSSGDLFHLSFQRNQNFPFAAKYFWNDLSGDEKFRCIIQGTHRTRDWFSKNGAGTCTCSDYIRQKQAELLLLLVKEIPESQINLGWDVVLLFRSFLQTWPYQLLCLNIIKMFTDGYRGSDTNKMKQILDLVIKCLLPNESPHAARSGIVKYTVKNDYHFILKELLKVIPDEIKLEYFSKNLEHFYYFHRNKDYMTISLIVNDDALKVLKDRMISKGDRFFEDLIQTGNDDELDKYIYTVFSDEDDDGKKSFEEKLNCIRNYHTV